jgi:hypothetical protein
VDGDALQTRNPWWHEFLDDRVTDMRESLGIAPTAAIELSLSKLRVVEPGAVLCNQSRREERAARDGVFGTLVVVLPGAFEGGEIVFESCSQPVHREGADESKEDPDEMAAALEASMWRPSARRTPYDLAYAVFYDHCSYVTEPVTSGAALCLVYDLVTTTPSDVPLFAGSSLVQKTVEETLTDYFNVAPPAVSKRCKISSDAWRTINEFAVERHFVYLVRHRTFEDLDEDEKQIAQSLAAFCDQSGGQFVLYLASVLCVHSYQAYESLDSSDDCEDETSVTLMDRWVKYGDSVVSEYPSIGVRSRQDVAPLGLVKQLRNDYVDSYRRGFTTNDGRGHMKQGAFTNALIVQPALIELRQMAKLPIEDVIEIIRNQLPESHEEAIRYARRVIYYRSEWHVSEWDELAPFVKILVEVNDVELFRELLRSVSLDQVDTDHSLCDAVRHFRWDACVDTLVKRIVTTSTLRGRVNLILSVIPSHPAPECIDSLLDALLSLHPWTDVEVTAPENSNSGGYLPDIEQFQDLLQLGLLSSREKMIDIASVYHAKEMVRLVAPAMANLVETDRTEPRLLFGLNHVWDIFHKMLPAIRNELFAVIRIPVHCDKCEELQSFLSSTEIEMIMTCPDNANYRHIERVINGSMVRQVGLVVESARTPRNALRLIKLEPQPHDEGLYHHAKMEAERIVDLTHPY